MCGVSKASGLERGLEVGRRLEVDRGLEVDKGLEVCWDDNTAVYTVTIEGNDGNNNQCYSDSSEPLQYQVCLKAKQLLNTCSTPMKMCHSNSLSLPIEALTSRYTLGSIQLP